MVWLIPMLGSALTLAFARINRKLRDYAPIVFISISLIFSLSMVVDTLRMRAVDWVSGEVLSTLPFDWHFPWVDSLGINLGVLVDPLNVLMATIVIAVGFFVTVFSVGYMKGKVGVTRFWVLVQLFIGGYVLLVMADNLLLMFVGWEIVGLCCTFLAGFWYKDRSKAAAGLKTNMLLRISDVCLLVSLLLVYAYAGTLNLMELQASSSWIAGLSSSGILVPTALLLFLGAVGKSAQFPLQDWLPDALAASPSSFNALTECLAGVFLVARILPIFHAAAFAELTFFFLIVAWMGAFTALLGALAAIAQRNIHKIFAYSILSVIGYMFAALGFGGLMQDMSSGYLAGTFLLTVDAFISGLLFLSGAYIAYVARSDNLKELGGVKSKLAYRGMEVGVLALIGLPPLSGFWCTNWIQTLATEVAGEASGHLSQVLIASGYGVLAVLVAAGGLTAFYGIRTFTLVFGGHTKKTGFETPSPMRISLGTMIVVTAIIDFTTPLLIPGFSSFLLSSQQNILFPDVLHVFGYILPTVSTVLSIISLSIGGSIAYFTYKTRRFNQAQIIKDHKLLRRFHNLLRNRFYFDSLFHRIAGVVKEFAGVTYKLVERNLDAFNDGVARFSRWFSKVLYVRERNLDAFNDGVARFSRWFSKTLYMYAETKGSMKLDNLISSLIKLINRHFKRTQTGVLSYNIFLTFIGAVLLTMLLLLFGGMTI